VVEERRLRGGGDLDRDRPSSRLKLVRLVHPLGTILPEQARSCIRIARTRERGHLRMREPGKGDAPLGRIDHRERPTDVTEAAVASVGGCRSGEEALESDVKTWGPPVGGGAV
jgi:hypothetical protein